jgi:hypothetical protein
MPRCVICGSRRYHGSDRTGWKCFRCGYTYIPEELLQKANNSKATNPLSESL